MRRARLRRSGWQAVLPWKALRGVGVRVARYVLARGSDSNNYAYSTTATQRWRFTPQLSLRDCASFCCSTTASSTVINFFLSC